MDKLSLESSGRFTQKNEGRSAKVETASISLLPLTKEREQGLDKLTVEYALKYNVSPIGVLSYETQLIEKLPKELKSNLPTIEDRGRVGRN